MKRIDDLTETEVLALADAEIDFYVDVASADAGVPLLPPRPAEPEYEAEPEPDQTFYSVSGTDYYFSNRDEALAVAEAISGSDRVDVGGNPKQAKPVPSYTSDAGSLAEVRALSAAAYDQHKAALETNKRKRDVYKGERAEYDRAIEKRNEVARDVYDHIAEVRDNEARRTALAVEMDRYLLLAGGDQAIATRFLLAAHPDAEDFGYSVSVEGSTP